MGAVDQIYEALTDDEAYARLPEVLAAADLHLVPLRAGLARSSVPSNG